MILIIDDDEAVRASISLLLKREGYQPKEAEGPEQALVMLEQGSWDLVLLDMNFSVKTTGEEGLSTLQKIKEQYPELPVILITGWGSIQLAVEGIKAGASDFISKPWDNDTLLQSIRTALKLADTRQVPSMSRGKLDKQFDFDNLIGADPAFVKVLETVGRVAATDAPVLILGESGTGKELIAEALHQNSHRSNNSFVKVNLGGISSTLFESEMFGHKRGAFTDARNDRVGRFEKANGGSIFLDEIGDLDPSSQVKLLRVLQDRKFEVLGSSETKTADVRVICATNKNLAEMAAEGTFREDLFYRINLITVKLPPLRERPSDIPLLVAFFLKNLEVLYGKEGLALSPEANRWLSNLPLSGNVRELKNLVERAVLISGKTKLEVKDLEEQLQDSPNKAAKSELPPVGSATLEEVEKQMILKAMTHHRNQVSKVARSLGLSRGALYRRLDKYGIRYED